MNLRADMIMDLLDKRSHGELARSQKELLDQLKSDRPINLCRKCRVVGEGSSLMHVCGTALESFEPVSVARV